MKTAKKHKPTNFFIQKNHSQEIVIFFCHISSLNLEENMENLKFTLNNFVARRETKRLLFKDKIN